MDQYNKLQFDYVVQDIHAILNWGYLPKRLHKWRTYILNALN